jgi:hypothetical protein
MKRGEVIKLNDLELEIINLATSYKMKKPKRHHIIGYKRSEFDIENESEMWFKERLGILGEFAFAKGYKYLFPDFEFNKNMMTNPGDFKTKDGLWINVKTTNGVNKKLIAIASSPNKADIYVQMCRISKLEVMYKGYIKRDDFIKPENISILPNCTMQNYIVDL